MNFNHSLYPFKLVAYRPCRLFRIIRVIFQSSADILSITDTKEQFFFFRINRAEGGTAVVRVSGEPYGSYDLHTDQEIEIQGTNGGTNLLQIRDGKASVIQASCPDLLCVHQGTVSRQGESIICLPNEVVVEISGAMEETAYDVLSE